MNQTSKLPPGQQARTDFPRFGLPPYADRFPSALDTRSVRVQINTDQSIDINLLASDVPRVTMTSDFHCVATWSHLNNTWTGVRFSDFYAHYVAPLVGDRTISGAVLHAQDGYKTSLPLADLLDETVMLADQLNGQPLTIEHGAPLRLIAPAHYGYKNLKHLKRIEFYTQLPVLKRGWRAFLDHPRARVVTEERGQWLPGWFLRYVFRPMIPATVETFDRAFQRFKRKSM